MKTGYSILFDDECCVIRHKKTGNTIANVQVAKNTMFPLQVSNVVNSTLVVKGINTEEDLCHLHYRHLNLNGLKLLSQKRMVVGLPKLVPLIFVKGVYQENKGEILFLVESHGELLMFLNYFMVIYVAR